MDKIKATEIAVEKYDFMTASELSIYLGIGRSQAYEIIRKINEKLSSEGFLTFSGKIPRKSLLEQLP